MKNIFTFLLSLMIIAIIGAGYSGVIAKERAIDKELSVVPLHYQIDQIKPKSELIEESILSEPEILSVSNYLDSQDIFCYQISLIGDPFIEGFHNARTNYLQREVTSHFKNKHLNSRRELRRVHRVQHRI